MRRLPVLILSLVAVSCAILPATASAAAGPPPDVAAPLFTVTNLNQVPPGFTISAKQAIALVDNLAKMESIDPLMTVGTSTRSPGSAATTRSSSSDGRRSPTNGHCQRSPRTALHRPVDRQPVHAMTMGTSSTRRGCWPPSPSFPPAAGAFAPPRLDGPRRPAMLLSSGSPTHCSARLTLRRVYACSIPHSSICW